MSTFLYGYAVYMKNDCFGVIEGTKDATPEEAAAEAHKRAPYLNRYDLLFVVPVWRNAGSERWVPCGSRTSAVVRRVPTPQFEVVV